MDRLTLFDSHLLDEDYWPKVDAYYFKQWNGYKMTCHTHEGMEIMYVISGTCRVDIEQQGSSNSVILSKGDFILLNAGTPHRLMMEDEVSCRMLNVEFRWRKLDSLLPSIRVLAAEQSSVSSLLSTPASYVVLHDADEVYQAMKSLVLELDCREQHGGMMAELLLSQLLIRIGRLQGATAASGMQQSNYYVQQTISYLHQNYDRDIQVKDIAAAVNLHPGYLHRIFKQHTELTITAYLTSLRIEKAKMLLLQTDIPVTEIYDYVGVASRQYFHMLFKKHTALTPVQYRHSVNTHRWIGDVSSEDS
ncbi:helix-turn-helix domain-containing protein [Paenibacillus sp. GCM10023252]|uniref:AraC family transcriptional regulator n=1 Tax=Paenibacillus sp. GCM10023252 TaxID=3252649 RepID=UPI003605F1A8